ncbi:MAG TPA: nucleotidyltransferase domain-containing protein [Vicinamibacterales bacterium]|nr:nucleotidyltransferase domain-containing protein [Vicinamibacterales bacterium]
MIAALRRGAARLVAERPEVLEVRLFGSLATGRAVPGSDADVLVIVRDGAPPFLERSVHFAPYFSGAGVGCDLFVYEAREADRLRRQPGSIVATALAEGTLLASRSEATRA